MKEVTMDLLLDCGCDPVTAENLLKRSHRYQSCKVDLFNPMDSLMKDLDDHMMERYQQLADLEERMLYQTDGIREGLLVIEETTAKCLPALKKITPAEEEPPGKPIAGSIFRELENEFGTPYYYNPQTGESQWDHPLEKKQNSMLQRLAALPMKPQQSAGDSFASAALKALTRAKDSEVQAEDHQISSSPGAEALVKEPSATGGSGGDVAPKVEEPSAPAGSGGDVQPAGSSEDQPAP